MNARFSDLTTFRLGGPCRRLFDCATPDALRDAIRDAGPDFLLIGGGSNLLAADEGVDAVVIRYAAERLSVSREGDDVIVHGSASLDALAAWSVEEGLEGLVCCSGIPGTVGGAIAGNAGAFGEQIGDRVARATMMDRGGVESERSPEDLGFAYRASRVSQLGILVSARLRLRPGDPARLRAHREEILALRAAKHPDWRVTPTAGSFFKNIEPTSKAERRQAAGWFLEQAGAKGLRVGGARTFERHANIIIAEPGCTAQDVHRLARCMARAVKEKFGLNLEREVRLVGRFPAEEEGS